MPRSGKDREAAENDHGGQVVLWDLELESYRNEARRIANRNLTLDEWRRYFPDTPYHATFNNLPVPPHEKPSNSP